MAKLTLQIKQFGNALARVRELEHPKSVVERDALIQRFEFTFDIGWKTLKSILASDYSVESPTPLQAFQNAVRVGIIPDDAVWLAMRDMRNLTSHVYSEPLAERLVQKIPSFIRGFEILAQLFHNPANRPTLV